MDEKSKKTLDLLCADKIDVREASDILGMSVDEVFELADGYTYFTTSEEAIEACEIERRTLDHIKNVALQKLEIKARDVLAKPLTISALSNMALMASSHGVLMPDYNAISDRKIYSPLGQKTHRIGENVIPSSRGGGHVQYKIPESYYGTGVSSVIKRV
jgi:hypothetical protein